MVAFTTLRTRHQNRLGITAASTAETDLNNECLNAAIAKVLGAGVESLHTTYSGIIQAVLSTTVTAHSAASALVTLNSVAGVFPGDFFTITTTGVQHLVHSVNATTKVVSVGVPLAASINGLAVTVQRRSLALATAGKVYQILEANSSAALRENLLVAGRAQFETSGSAVVYRVGYAENLEGAYVNLYPAPDAGTQYFITQARAAAEDADVPLSEAQAAEVLALAYYLRTLHSGNAILSVLAEKAYDLVRGLRNDNATSSGVIQRR